jgi:hypothetical protein
VNGSLFYDEDTDEINSDEMKEIYQSYIISNNGAELLKKYTDEIVQYHEDLDVYVWHITHFGTPWTGVFVEVSY